MSIYALIPFSIFFCCALALLHCQRRMRSMLAQRYPGVWSGLSDATWFRDVAVFQFVWERQDKALGDSDITRLSRRMHMLQIVGVIAWITYVILLFGRP